MFQNFQSAIDYIKRKTKMTENVDAYYGESEAGLDEIDLSFLDEA